MKPGSSRNSRCRLYTTRSAKKLDRLSLEAIFSQNSKTPISANADLGVDVGIDQTPLTLAYQAAIDRINEAVAPYLGENAVIRGDKAEVDVSPPITADRIVSRSTALFSRFADRFPIMILKPQSTTSSILSVAV